MYFNLMSNKDIYNYYYYCYYYSLIWVCERAQRASLTDDFHGFIKSRKRSIFVIDSYSVQKGMQSSKQGMWKGHYLSRKGIRKGYLFCKKKKKKKWYTKGWRVGPRDGTFPYKNLLSTPLPRPPGQSLSQGHYHPIYQEARKGCIYFIIVWLIF